MESKTADTVLGCAAPRSRRSGAADAEDKSAPPIGASAAAVVAAAVVAAAAVVVAAGRAPVRAGDLARVRVTPPGLDAFAAAMAAATTGAAAAAVEVIPTDDEAAAAPGTGTWETVLWPPAGA